MNSSPRNDGARDASDDETLRAFNEIMARWDEPLHTAQSAATEAEGTAIAADANAARPEIRRGAAESRSSTAEERSGRSMAEMRRLQAERRRRAEAAAAAANLAPVHEESTGGGPRDADLSYLDAMERAEALMDADPENHFVPPEPKTSLRPRNAGAVAALVASIVIAVAFGFFIDSPLSGAMTVLGCTMFIFCLVYLAFKAASTQNADNSDEGTV
ncbi:hypothetical protein JT358_05010 [Micrococcales bacterium 31B]|nr:hypothetical protein [Micrococcales bacterium 31B]